MTEEEIKAIVTQIGDAKLNEGDVDFGKFGNGVTIKEAATKIAKDFFEEAKENQAIAVIGVVLSINRNVNNLVNPRKEHFLKVTNNSIKSINDLSKLLQEKSEVEFYKLWNYKSPRRYNILRELVNRIQNFESNFQNDDYRKINEWARNFDANNFENDRLRFPYFRLASLQHLRMAFGVEVINPARHVLDTLSKLFPEETVTQENSIQLMEEVSAITGIRPFIHDKMFFKYGACGYLKNLVAFLSIPYDL